MSARRLEFPLLGFSVSPPHGYTVQVATRERALLKHPARPTSLSLYRIELGTGGQAPTLEKRLVSQLRSRLGKVAKIRLGSASMGGAPARRLDLQGLRKGKPWTLAVCWRIHGGQAFVVEVLSPAGAPAGPILDPLLTGLRWLKPDRG